MMTTGERDAIISPPHGLHIFNTDERCLNYYDATYQYWACYCDDCKTKIIYLDEDDCSIDFYNDYVLGDPAANYIIVIDTGVVIYSCAIPTQSAIDFSSVPSSMHVKIVNYGTILGLGGWGGSGNVDSLDIECFSSDPTDGTAGFPAIKTKPGVTIQILNHGVVAGGGGGGGGGDRNPSGFGGGGGGGAGGTANYTSPPGHGGGVRFIDGLLCVTIFYASDGTGGTETMGGAGGVGAEGGGTGGNGGGLGQPGQNGTGTNPGIGGAAGKAIEGGSGNSIVNFGAGQSYGGVD